MTTDPDDGLFCAYVLDGRGGGHAATWDDIRCWSPRDGVLWVQLIRTDEAARRWLTAESGVPQVICDALLAEDSRPRAVIEHGGLLISLRGVNLAPGGDPQDLVSLGLWTDGRRLIGVQRRQSYGVSDVCEALQRGAGPADPGDFLADLTDRMLDHLRPSVSGMADDLDELEDALLDRPGPKLRSRLAELRRQAIGLRRFLVPQREALLRLVRESPPWIDEQDRGRLRESAERLTRYLDDISAMHDRAAVTHEELTTRLAEESNRAVLRLTLLASMLLPPSMVAALFGMNVGGIPGSDTPWAFGAICAVLFVFAMFQLWLLRRIRWI